MRTFISLTCLSICLLGYPAQAQADLEQALKEAETYILLEQALKEAETYILLEEWSHAESVYQGLKQQYPKDNRIYLAIGKLYLRRKQWDQAVTQFEQTTRLAPKQAEAWGLLGFAQQQRQNWRAAYEAYQQASRLSPHDPAYQKMVRELEKKLPKQHQRPPELVQKLQIAERYLSLRQYPQALQIYQQLQQKYPQFAEAYSGQGLALLQQQKYREAITALQQATRLAPHQGDNWVNLGSAHWALNEYIEAEQAYHQAVTLNPRDPELMKALTLAEEKIAQIQQPLSKRILPQDLPSGFGPTSVPSTAQQQFLGVPVSEAADAAEKRIPARDLLPQPGGDPELAALLADIPEQSSGSESDINFYQRKYVAFFQRQNTPLNGIIAKWFVQDLPRFGYTLMNTSVDTPLEPFLTEILKFQQNQAGSEAAATEKPDLRFADKLVPWSETKRIMRSNYVFAPYWSFGPIEVKGPFKVQTKDDTYYEVRVTSKLTVDVPILKFTGKSWDTYGEVKQTWDLIRDYRVGGESKSYLEPYLPLKKVDPSQEMMPEALALFAKEKAEPEKAKLHVLVTDVKKYDDFILRADVKKADMLLQNVLIGFGERETPKALGVNLDDGYKIWEAKLEGEKEILREIGYVRVRNMDEKLAHTQPILVGRDFELGDIVKEYPKTGISQAIRTGTTSLNLGGSGQFPMQSGWFVPQGIFETEYSLGRLIGISEVYQVVSGGLNWPTNYPGVEQVYVMSGFAETGWVKRFYLRQLVFSAGIRAGALIGALINHPGVKEGVPIQSSWGITPTLGLHFQATPDLLLGADIGARIYPGWGLAAGEKDTWRYEQNGYKSSVTYPQLSSIGPFISIFGTYAF